MMTNKASFKDNYKTLETKIKVKFSNRALLEEALTHSSYSKRKGYFGVPFNERLEFLGDAVLKLIVSHYLFATYETHNEGELSKLRAHYISDMFLVRMAEYLSLGNFLRFSYGESQSGGASKPSNLANAFEALLGAVYLDKGLDVASEFFHWLVTLVNDDGLADVDVVDNKSRLQEHCQAHSWALPNYQVVDEEGPEHEKLFVTCVTITNDQGDHSFKGVGKTKKLSEQCAARLVLDFLEI